MAGLLEARIGKARSRRGVEVGEARTEHLGMKNWSEQSAVFLVKDPHWTFVWWELSEATRQSVSEELGREANGAQLCLRIHDVTDIIFDGHNSHFSFDVEVVGPTDHWYLHVPVAGRDYCAEVGFKADGRFVVAARSNTVRLPKDGPVQPAWIP